MGTLLVGVTTLAGSVGVALRGGVGAVVSPSASTLSVLSTCVGLRGGVAGSVAKQVVVLDEATR